MPYIRKTRNLYDIQCKYDGKWESVNTEESRQDAKRSKSEYKANDQYAQDVRIVKYREKL